MDKLSLEYCEQISVDTLTQETTSQSILIVSGNRNIYIAVNTVLRLANFLREKGFKI